MIAVLFEAEVAPEGQARYLALAAELKPLLSTVDGFISIERFQSLTTPGKILSLSRGRDEQAVQVMAETWKAHPRDARHQRDAVKRLIA